jgi:hypothetical protein
VLLQEEPPLHIAGIKHYPNTNVPTLSSSWESLTQARFEKNICNAYHTVVTHQFSSETNLPRQKKWLNVLLSNYSRKNINRANRFAIRNSISYSAYCRIQPTLDYYTLVVRYFNKKLDTSHTLNCETIPSETRPSFHIKLSFEP